VEIEVPPLPDGARTAFVEYAPTHGDFAVAGAAVVRAPDACAIALLGAGATPLRAQAAEQALTNGAAAHDAAAIAAQDVDDPWRRALTATLVGEAIERTAV
jgi:CO/xanthine dehydrogenase FAD-binding subunit